MRKRIEIISLAPEMDIRTLQQKPGVVLRYKTEIGTQEQFDMQGSQKQILDMFKIDNFTDVSGRKYDIEMENIDGKLVIKSFSPVDDRQISYTDFEALQRAVDKIQDTLSRGMAAVPQKNIIEPHKQG